MSSFSVVNPIVKLSSGRVGVVGGVTGIVVLVGFLAPIWVTVLVGFILVFVVGLVHALRQAARKVETILAEELGDVDTQRRRL